jgi:hypothetical protein
MLAYNLFCRRDKDFYCAVPEDRPVPSFLGDHKWEFGGKLVEGSRVMLPKAMKVAVRFNGFYIFHPFERPKMAS